MAVLGAALPIATTLYISWQRALETVRQQLSNYTALIHNRMENIVDDAKVIPYRLNDLKNIQPCSEDHINLMRQLMMMTRSLKQVSYFENNQLKCSSCGISKAQIIIDNNIFYYSKKGPFALIAIKPLEFVHQKFMQISAYNYNP